MGRLTGCSAHQEIKVSSSSKCAVARCDLFNSNRVNITDACKAGITVEELDDLRRGSGSVSFLLWFTHKNQSSFFSNGRSSSGCGPCFIEKRIPEYKCAVTIIGHIRTISRGSIRPRNATSDRNRWSGERKETHTHTQDLCHV